MKPIRRVNHCSCPATDSPALVTREMVYARTSELATMAGRHPHQITRCDYERAKLELTGESDSELQEAILSSSV